MCSKIVSTLIAFFPVGIGMFLSCDIYWCLRARESESDNGRERLLEEGKIPGKPVNYFQYSKSTYLEPELLIIKCSTLIIADERTT